MVSVFFVSGVVAIWEVEVRGVSVEISDMGMVSSSRTLSITGLGMGSIMVGVWMLVSSRVSSL